MHITHIHSQGTATITEGSRLEVKKQVSELRYTVEYTILKRKSSNTTSNFSKSIVLSIFPEYFKGIKGEQDGHEKKLLLLRFTIATKIGKCPITNTLWSYKEI